MKGKRMRQTIRLYCMLNTKKRIEYIAYMKKAPFDKKKYLAIQGRIFSRE